MTSVEPGLVPVSVLVNNAVVALPARHIRGKLTGDDGDRDADMYVLDDPAKSASPAISRRRRLNDRRQNRLARPRHCDEHGVGAGSAQTRRRLRDLFRFQQRGDPTAVRFDARCDRGDDEARSDMEADRDRAHRQHRRRCVEPGTLATSLGGGESGAGLSRHARIVSRRAARDRRAEGDECDAGGRAQNRRVELSRQ